MSIQKRTTKTGQTRFIARWYDKAGKERSKSFTRAKDAKLYLADIETRRAMGADTAPRRETVLDIYNGWLDSRPIRETSRTVYEYTRDKNLTPLHNYPAAELTNADVREWTTALRTGRTWVAKDDAGLSETGVRNSARHLRSAMAWGVKTRRIAYNPVIVEPGDTAIEPTEIPTLAEIQATIDKLRAGGAQYEQTPKPDSKLHAGKKTYTATQTPEPVMADMMLAAVYTGLRISELAGLIVGEVDLDAGIIRVRKQLSKPTPRERIPLKTRNSRRDVPIPKELEPALRRNLGGKDAAAFVFQSKTGAPLGTSRIAVKVKRAAHAVGAQRVHFHALRHFYASTLITAGVPVQDVAAVMGHTVDMTIKTYTHVLDGHRERVLAGIAQAAGEHGILTGSPALRVVEGGA